LSAILRLAPGDVAPWDGTYKLVAHYGEPMGRMVPMKRGERFPLIGVTDDSELWFVLMDESEIPEAA
jgi:hypothetical protein